MSKGCPMSKYPELTEKQVERFCNDGCSVECDKFLEEYVTNLKKRGKYNEKR